MEDYVARAKEIGFTDAYAFDVDALSFEDAEILREACVANDCGMYGRYWTCPPAVGSIEEVVAKVRSYRRGIAVQLLTEGVSQVFLPELFAELAHSFNEMIRALAAEIQIAYGETFCLGMSGCQLCKRCAYPEGQCRHPQDMIPCVSGHCLNIYRLWDSCGGRRGDLEESEFFGVLLYEKRS